jgi:predicted HAD superfamily Cof-like phosphohydrolase
MAKWGVATVGNTDVMSMVKKFAEVMGQEPNPSLSESLIDEEYEEWSFESSLQSGEVAKHYAQKYDPVAELKELSDLVYVIYGYANVRGWDLDEAVRRVHENNIGRCIQPDGSIQRREDGKILKNKDFPKVELGDLV